jgi:hypothetical protein
MIKKQNKTIIMVLKCKKDSDGVLNGRGKRNREGIGCEKDQSMFYLSIYLWRWN